MHEPKNEWKLIHFAVFLAKKPSELLRERKNDFWDILNRRIGTTERATTKTVASSKRTINGLSKDAFFFKKNLFLLGVKNRWKKGESSGFRTRISFINRRCFAVNGPIALKTYCQFDVLSNDSEIGKRYEFLVQNRKKKSKNSIFLCLRAFLQKYSTKFFGASNIKN